MSAQCLQPLLLSHQAGVFFCKEPLDSLGAAEHSPVSCRTERPQWFLFHQQMCSGCGVEATNI